jgi:hypothetical protein
MILREARLSVEVDEARHMLAGIGDRFAESGRLNASRMTEAEAMYD